MSRTVAVGIQNFEDYITKKCFYVDKTSFIKEWWKSNDSVTVVMRPRRFGKTLTMDMVKTFFSLEYKDKGESIFGNLDIWQDEEMRALQGSYPVIFISFADIKPKSYESFKIQMNYLLYEISGKVKFLLESSKVNEHAKEIIKKINLDMINNTAIKSIKNICQAMSEYYEKKVIIILDEYDTPMLEAYANGYWNEAIYFLRSFFNSTFKTNPYMERALMTGIARISKESIFSDFNHVKLVTMLSNKYADCFGFTEKEVFSAMDEYKLREKGAVKKWYNGFSIGNKKDIYNPWSIINYLSNEGIIAPYWANSSSNALVNSLLQTSNVNLKQMLEALLAGDEVKTVIDEEIVYNRLNATPKRILSLLFSAGYLTGTRVEPIDLDRLEYKLHITNYETLVMLRTMVSDWFQAEDCSYNEFIKAMLEDDIDAMEEYINKIAFVTFSHFDVGGNLSEKVEPERFYHGFILGLMVDLRDRYIITSNRESGFGRYDIMLEPKNDTDNAIIIEFKVFKPKREKDLQEAVANALKQIEDRHYDAIFIEKGISKERIKKYGFAFEGKNVLIGNQV